MPTRTEHLLPQIEANPELADALLETAEDLSPLVDDVAPERPDDLCSIWDGIDSALAGLVRVRVTEMGAMIERRTSSPARPIHKETTPILDDAPLIG